MADTVPDLGEHINTVLRPPYPCPSCDNNEPYAVHQNGIRWQCGSTQFLPPMLTGPNRKRAA